MIPCLMEKHITIGIAGHVDHGKTSLVRCLTGMDTDRLLEEKRRGLSIESGIAPMALSSGERVALMDVPGHTDFLKNTIRGLSNVDAAVLVVAADDGVMPQTREHFEILRFFGAETGFVVLSKADLVDAETLELAELEVRELLGGSFLETSPIIPFSEVDRRGLDEVRARIEWLVKTSQEKDVHAPFRLWIDQVRSFPGYGTVISGTILSGKLLRGDALHLLPAGTKTSARSLEIHHQYAEEASAGQRVGINLHKVPLKDVERGMVLAEPGTAQSSDSLNVDLKVLPYVSKPIRSRQRVKIYLGTSVTSTLVVLMDREQLEPGESGLAQFRLMKPIGALPGDAFVVCPLNIQTIIAGGKVLEISHQKYRKARASMMISCLKALQNNNPGEYVIQTLKSNPYRLARASELARDTVFSVKEIEAVIAEMAGNGDVLSFKDSGFFAKEAYQKLKENIYEATERILKEDPLKTNVKANEIRFQVAPSLDGLVFQSILDELCSDGKLIKKDGGVKVPNLSTGLSEARDRLIGMLLDYAQESGLVPFSADTFWKLHRKQLNKNEIQRLLDYLHGQGRLIRLNNRRFIAPRAMEQIKMRAKAVIKRNGVLAIGDCKEVLGYGRTVGIPVFEYLDSIGFTRRQGDTRTLQ